MAYDCNCKGISDIHTAQALAQAEARGETYKDAESLYAAALACKKADPNAKITGREDVNGCDFYKGCCRPVFDAAASGKPVTVPIRVITTPRTKILDMTPTGTTSS